MYVIEPLSKTFTFTCAFPEIVIDVGIISNRFKHLFQFINIVRNCFVNGQIISFSIVMNNAVTEASNVTPGNLWMSDFKIRRDIFDIFNHLDQAEYDSINQLFIGKS